MVHARLWILLPLLLSLHATAQSAAPCTVHDLEPFDAGGDAATGHGIGYYALRNIAKHPCTLHGVPLLHFFDTNAHPLKVPYGKNSGDFMSQPQPERNLTLAPGDFAHFSIGTNTGDQTFRFHSVQVDLPGSSSPLLTLSQWDGGLDGLDVSALTAGYATEDTGESPVQPVHRLSSSAHAPAIALSIVTTPRIGFDAHLRFVNNSPHPVSTAMLQCSLDETLTAGDGQIIHGSVDCEAWNGPTSLDGMLPAGLRVTADVSTPEALAGLCRSGTWTAALILRLAGQTIRYAPIPVHVTRVDCSDSTHSGDQATALAQDPHAPHIRWSIFSASGIRFGVQITTPANQAPPTGQVFPRLGTAPQFTVGTPILLHLFLDNVGDTPVSLTLGRNAFRVYIRTEGLNVPIVKVDPQQAVPIGEPGKIIIIPPHTWQALATFDLASMFHLAPGGYQVVMAPETLLGAAAAANAPATGWPYTENDAAVSLSVKIVP